MLARRRRALRDITIHGDQQWRPVLSRRTAGNMCGRRGFSRAVEREWHRACADDLVPIDRDDERALVDGADRSISSRLIGMMNGRLWTEQTEGSEALHFTLCLPVAIEQAKRQADSGASLRDVDVLV